LEPPQFIIYSHKNVGKASFVSANMIANQTIPPSFNHAVIVGDLDGYAIEIEEKWQGESDGLSRQEEPFAAKAHKRVAVI